MASILLNHLYEVGLAIILITYFSEKYLYKKEYRKNIKILLINTFTKEDDIKKELEDFHYSDYIYDMLDSKVKFILYLELWFICLLQAILFYYVSKTITTSTYEISICTGIIAFIESKSNYRDYKLKEDELMEIEKKYIDFKLKQLAELK